MRFKNLKNTQKTETLSPAHRVHRVHFGPEHRMNTGKKAGAHDLKSSSFITQIGTLHTMNTVHTVCKHIVTRFKHIVRGHNGVKAVCSCAGCIYRGQK